MCTSVLFLCVYVTCTDACVCDMCVTCVWHENLSEICVEHACTTCVWMCESDSSTHSLAHRLDLPFAPHLFLRVGESCVEPMVAGLTPSYFSTAQLLCTLPLRYCANECDVCVYVYVSVLRVPCMTCLTLKSVWYAACATCMWLVGGVWLVCLTCGRVCKCDCMSWTCRLCVNVICVTCGCMCLTCVYVCVCDVCDACDGSMYVWRVCLCLFVCSITHTDWRVGCVYVCVCVCELRLWCVGNVCVTCVHVIVCVCVTCVRSMWVLRVCVIWVKKRLLWRMWLWRVCVYDMCLTCVSDVYVYDVLFLCNVCACA